MARIFIISSFAVSDKSGHLLIDDIRTFQFFLEEASDFAFYTTPYSCKNISSLFPDSSHHLANVQSNRIDISPCSRIIWLGFTELRLLLFVLLNFFKKPRIILVATNNFSHGRLQARGIYLSFFFWLIHPFILRVVLHTNFEEKLVHQHIPSLKHKTFVKKHHLMTPSYENHNQSPSERYLKSAISFFGPIKPDKPIAPLLHLIRSDKEHRFHYYIYNINVSDVTQGLGLDSTPSNVHVVETWQSHAEHISSLARSTFIFMSQDSNYEGKLSGNLCDCISSAIPYIARRMEPVTSLERKYGVLGYTADFSDPEWAECFIKSIELRLYQRYYANLLRIASAHSYDAVTSDLKAALLS